MLAFPAVAFLLPVLLQPSPVVVGEGLASNLEALGLGRRGFLVFAAYFVTVHPVLEELVWRGVLEPEGETPKQGPRSMDAWFAAYHLLVIHYLFRREWLLMAGVFLVLAVTAWVWRRWQTVSGGLAVPVLSHAAGDFGVILATWWLMR